MRKLTILCLLAFLSLTAESHARLFWQTFGSVTSDGACGCNWNTNQDYFVPRHGDSCRYGLFSPCKTSCTSSPAAKNCHPLHHGYCTNYGPWHYCWRNLVYGCYCGCSPVKPFKCSCSPTPYRGPWLYGCRKGCCGVGARRCHGGICHAGACGVGGCGCHAMLPCEWPYQLAAPNVEPAGMQILGGLPVQGDELLASMSVDFAPQSSQPNQLPQQEQQQLPSLGAPR